MGLVYGLALGWELGFGVIVLIAVLGVGFGIYVMLVWFVLIGVFDLLAACWFMVCVCLCFVGL